MPGPSDTSLAAMLLCQRLVDTPVAPLKSSEYWSLLEQIGDPAALLGVDARTIARTWGIDQSLAERVAQLLDVATAFAFHLDEVSQSGLRLVTSVDGDYPVLLTDRLGRSAPPLLYVAGDPKLLGTDLLGIVGSRKLTEASVEVVREVSMRAATRGLGIVSGGAKGVDQLAMTACLDREGHTVGILAESLMHAIRDVEARRAIGDGRLCLCTPYKPTAGFSVANAMGRNKLIYALSRATLVVAADAERGGTWAGAVEALRQATVPILVWTGEGAGEGNSLLVERGASGVASLSDVFPLFEQAMRPEGVMRRRPPYDQLALMFGATQVPPGTHPGASNGNLAPLGDQ
jgi:predicted Rossmann fold nucleotide-binding protein DprA/Smf involved in DNA uptake